MATVRIGNTIYDGKTGHSWEAPFPWGWFIFGAILVFVLNGCATPRCSCDAFPSHAQIQTARENAQCWAVDRDVAPYQCCFLGNALYCELDNTWTRK